MARIEIIEPRDQEAHFGLYRTSAGGDESIFVRRKVGDPTDYMHTKSRKLARQRTNFALATQHYAQLSPSQKAITRHQFEEVEFIQSHGKTDTKLLSGRQLFIAKEMRSLNATGKQLILPYELCITLTDYGLNPLSGELWLRYLIDGDWKDIKKEQLTPGNWLFSQVPRGQEAYQIEGEASGFFDPHLEEHQYMSEDYLLTHHYHKLYASVPGYSYSFVSRYWVLSHIRTPPYSYGTLHVNSKLKTYDFTGTITIALWRLPYPYPPEGEICRQTYPVAPAGDVYQQYYSTFSGIAIQEGVDYWLRHWKSDFNTDLWYGGIWAAEIP